MKISATPLKRCQQGAYNIKQTIPTMNKQICMVGRPNYAHVFFHDHFN